MMSRTLIDRVLRDEADSADGRDRLCSHFLALCVQRTWFPDFTVTSSVPVRTSHAEQDPVEDRIKRGSGSFAGYGFGNWR